MHEDLQKPPVLDLDAIMQPIEGENPAGENLRYSGLYDEIAEARRADKDVAQGDWQSELKVADYRRVVELAVPALTGRSKDLQVASWLSESLVRQYGFAGLRDGMKLLAGLQEAFWDNLYPEIDEGDMEGRANAISWMDEQASFAARNAPITAGPGYGLIGLEDAKRFDFPENIDSLDSEEQGRILALKHQAEKENRVTAEMWKKAKAQTRRRFCEETNFALEECWAAYNDLNRVIDEKFDRNQMPGLSNLKKALEEIHTNVKKLLEEKRIEEPDESDVEEGEASESLNGESRPADGGSVSGRREALKRLGEIAAFFQRTEPHSPVAYLVQRAVKWGNMPLESWLQDVIKDENVLHQLRQTLGLDTEAAAYDAAYADTGTATEQTSDEW
jgi:type VI secretion system protein ImpA